MKYKQSIVTLILLLQATPTLAQDYTTTNPNDRIGVRSIIRDATGRRAGTIERGYGNRLIIRDADGHRTHTVTPGPGNRLILRDSNGHRTGTIESSQ